MMYDDGIANEFEESHQKGLRRGFDLGWSYKGRFDRSIIEDRIQKLGETHPNSDKKNNIIRIQALKGILKELENHNNNRENISINSW